MSESFSEKPLDFLSPRQAPPEPQAHTEVFKPARTFRYVLPAVLFVLVVAGIAWVTQFMPNWRATKSTVSAPAANSAKSVIKFPVTRAIWDKDDEEYALEQEKGTEGHFDFPFENSSAGPGQIGLLTRSCDCTHLEVCLVPSAEWDAYRDQIVKNPLQAKAGTWNWIKVEESPDKGFEVPPEAKGLVRVRWHGRKEPGSHLRLSIRVWHQPKGNVRERGFEDLQVPIVMAAPLLYKPARVHVGVLGPRDTGLAEFTLWSATRDKVDFKIVDSADPLFVHEIKQLSVSECQELEKKMRTGGENTRVHAAFQLKVKVMEQDDKGKQLDQGPFTHPLGYVIGEDQHAGPTVSGIVKGEVLVGNTEDRGRVDLKIFPASQGATRLGALVG